MADDIKTSLEKLIDRHLKEQNDARDMDVLAPARVKLLSRQMDELVKMAREVEETLATQQSNSRMVLVAQETPDGQHLSEFILTPQNADQAFKLLMAAASLMAHAAIHLGKSEYGCGHPGHLMRLIISTALREMDAESPGSLKEYVEAVAVEAKKGGLPSVEEPTVDSLKRTLH